MSFTTAMIRRWPLRVQHRHAEITIYGREY
jgi:hypothetical protein